MKSRKSYLARTRYSMRALMKKSDDRDLAGQLLIAIGVLVLVSFLVSGALLLTEGRCRAESPFSNYWNCLFWTAMDYLGNPSGIGSWEVVTSGGRVVAIVVQMIAFALYAAFTGLFVALIMAWYKFIVKRARLEKCYKDLLKAFHRQYARDLSKVSNHNCYVVPSQKLLATLQVNANMDFKEVAEVADRFYGFRIKNLANIHSIEDQGTSDRFIVEHFPVNREYGCCIERGSNVTIVAPASDISVGIGWFSYYLALFGGFNYISKDYDADPLHRTSYYNYEEVVTDKATLLQRKAFMNDLEQFGKRENSWIVFLLSFTPSKSKPGDIHMSYAQVGGSNPTVNNLGAYNTVSQALVSQLTGKTIHSPSSIFQLQPKNVILVDDTLRENVNSFTMRISSNILKADTERLLIAKAIAAIFDRHLRNVPCNGIPDASRADLENKTTETYSPRDWGGD